MESEQLQTDEPGQPESALVKPPTHAMMKAAYKWLCSFMMEERIRGKCSPPQSCEFLIDALSPDDRAAYLADGELNWRQWNFAFSDYADALSTPRSLI